MVKVKKGKRLKVGLALLKPTLLKIGHGWRMSLYTMTLTWQKKFDPGSVEVKKM